MGQCCGMERRVTMVEVSGKKQQSREELYKEEPMNIEAKSIKASESAQLLERAAEPEESKGLSEQQISAINADSAKEGFASVVDDSRGRATVPEGNQLRNRSTSPGAYPAAKVEPVVPVEPAKPAPMTAAEKKARREALRALMFNNKEGEFVARNPGDLNGSAFQIQRSNNSQLYCHDHLNQTTVDLCNNSEIVIGPTKAAVFLRNCNDCTFVVFCQQLRLRDCNNCTIMLYCQTEPIVEACQNIKFTTMTYWYEDLLNQMQIASVSPWTNKWNCIFDFTPNRGAENGDPNWSILSALNWRMLAPLGEIREKVSKVRSMKGDESVKNLNDITDEDLESITLEFDEEQEIMSGLFDVGPYFNEFSHNIIKGVIPSAQFKGQAQDHEHSVFIIAFAPNFQGIFDSTNEYLAHVEEGGVVDLKHTLQYKLLITCGTFVKENKKTDTQDVWVEETRSVLLNEDQKAQLCDAMEADQFVAESPDMMVVAIEFRLKPQGESKAFKQLKQDCAALVNEHPSQVCYTLDADKVTQAAHMVFRQFSVEETGHSIA